MKLSLNALFPILLLLTSSHSLYINPYISHSFDFPHIPFHIALPHIHTPERCVEPYALVPNEFKITQTFPPLKFQGYNAIRFRFSTMLTEGQYGTLFSSAPDCSQLLLHDERGKAYMLVSYSIRPFVSYSQSFRNSWAHGQNEGGITIKVTGSYLRNVNETNTLQLLCTPRIVQRLQVQQALQFRNIHGEDINFKEYRRMVLRL